MFEVPGPGSLLDDPLPHAAPHDRDALPGAGTSTLDPPILAAPECARFRLHCGCDFDAPESLKTCGGTVFVFTRRSPDRTTSNEDSVAVLPVGETSGVLAVADGMGGFRGGERASAQIVQALAASIAETFHGRSRLRTALLDGIEAANEAVQSLGIGSASTLALVEIRDGAVRPYHVGDSMILVVGQRGKIKLQTISHSPVGFAVEAGLLDEAEALHHADRHVVSNFVGTPAMRIEIGPPLTLAPRDTLLLASDGLFDNLRIDEIVERIRKGPLDAAMRNLVQDAFARMRDADGDDPCKPDDLTIVLYRPR